MLGANTLLLTFTIGLSAAHVSLDFPEARDLSLDFLDSFRTPAPCGMPKGDSTTTFASGSTFNVTWHLGYPHQGGFKVELLDASEKLIEPLTPKNGGSKGNGWIDEDTTAQSQMVTLPEDMECKGCTVRAKRCCMSVLESPQWFDAE